MTLVELAVVESPPSVDLDRLRKGLGEHARTFVDRPGFRPLAIFARSESGELLGGAAGTVNWNWLDLSLPWVHQEMRGSGLGSRLLTRIEQEARARGCTRAHVDTFSYQALPFYERHGYRVSAELEDYPPGHRRLYLRKELSTK